MSLLFETQPGQEGKLRKSSLRSWTFLAKNFSEFLWIIFGEKILSRKFCTESIKSGLCLFALDMQHEAHFQETCRRNAKQINARKKRPKVKAFVRLYGDVMKEEKLKKKFQQNGGNVSTNDVYFIQAFCSKHNKKYIAVKDSVTENKTEQVYTICFCVPNNTVNCKKNCNN
ncbi:hypothetical protein RFI_27813 [Reticulomyxa filosa]|uniref:Uncharacterized protein n=1 Tax=Reticulomyxa filosa TaxID=46433 RepID=X6M7Y5_RETFI|nr:hypothetical protein RFI_27813 [Reticulomyxa filosa]|eukprot:ETO09567.1 hypothetical protein RFI_27813 [Reticulomyxa filosa]